MELLTLPFLIEFFSCSFSTWNETIRHDVRENESRQSKRTNGERALRMEIG